MAMNVSLPPLLEEFIRGKIAKGEFHSVEEVICEGLRLLQLQEEWKEDARCKIDVGWQQAKSGQLRTLEQTRESLRERKKAQTG
jgi:putative addiction module CopG family antidote